MYRRLCVCALAAFICILGQKPFQANAQTPTSQPAGATGAKPDADKPKADADKPKAEEKTERPAKKLNIVVIPKGTTHEFWKSVHAGAEKAAQEIGNIEITFTGPQLENDREQQISLVQNFISKKVDAIVLAPLDNRALVSAVRQATEAKIPVIIIDSGLDGEAGKDFVSFVATDNFKGGQLAADCMAKAMDNKGKVLLLRVMEGSASTGERERGFIDGIAKYKDIKLIDPKRYAGPTQDTALRESENLLIANADLQGVFSPNESSSLGMRMALTNKGLVGKMKFVGFDANATIIKALKDGEYVGIVVQDPMKMGFLGVKTAVDHIQGKNVPKLQDTGAVLITKENMDKPEFAELLNPPLKKYLKN